MLILGIETSCDETAASLLEVAGSKLQPKIKVLSNTISSQVKIHARYGGVVPEVAARKHIEVIIPIIKKSLQSTKQRLQSLDAIAVTYGPGLVTSLRVGVDTAKTLAYALKKPLIPVNHIEGHIYSNWLKPMKKPMVNSALEVQKLKASNINFPALVLVVSGGHTELVLMRNHGNYEIIGKTLDDAVGEAFDKVAKMIGLNYPGGPAVSALADKFNARDLRLNIQLPRPMINSPDFNFSFAGLKTAVLYRVRELAGQYALKDLAGPVAYEFQKAAIETLVSKTIKAAKKLNIKTIMLAGGVSANHKLRVELEKAVNDLAGISYIQPNLEYTTDNAAMIAVAGHFNYIKNPSKYKDGWKKIKVDPNLEL